MSFWDAFHTATPWVQTFVLLAVFGCVLAVTVSLFRLLQLLRTDHMPAEMMFAIQQDNELLHRRTTVSREKASRLPVEPSATKNGPTDKQ